MKKQVVVIISRSNSSSSTNTSANTNSNTSRWWYVSYEIPKGNRDLAKGRRKGGVRVKYNNDNTKI